MGGGRGVNVAPYVVTTSILPDTSPLRLYVGYEIGLIQDSRCKQAELIDADVVLDDANGR